MSLAVILSTRCPRRRGVPRAEERLHKEILHTYRTSTRSILRLMTKHIESTHYGWQVSWEEEDTGELESSELTH